MKNILLFCKIVLLGAGAAAAPWFAADALAAFAGAWQGSRAAGMGGAFIAVADDPGALAYNQAGAAQIRFLEAGFMYAKMYNGLEGVNLGTNQVAAVIPLNEFGTAGFGWTSFSSSNEYKEDTLCVSYAQWITRYIAGGINVKYLGHAFSIDGRTINDPVFANGRSKYDFTFDTGLFSKIKVGQEGENLTLGLAARNITRPDLGLKTTDNVPLELGLGISYQTHKGVLPAIDLTYRLQDWGGDEDRFNVRVGAETWMLDDLLSIRGGCNVNELSFGFGIAPALLNTQLSIDYAFLLPFQIKETTGTHQLSLVIKFAH